MLGAVKEIILNGYMLKATVEVDMEYKDIDITCHDADTRQFIDSIPVDDIGEFIESPNMILISESTTIVARPKKRSVWDMREHCITFTRCDLSIEYHDDFADSLGEVVPRNSQPFTTDNTSHGDAIEQLNRYHNVLKYVHNAILHEIDKGNTPTLIQEEHGGAGIGLIEDLLNEVK